MVDSAQIRAAIAGADRHLNAWHGAPPVREQLAALAEATDADERADHYGRGGHTERLERRVAEAPRQGGRRLHAERDDGAADRAPDLERPAGDPHRRVPPHLSSRPPRGACVRASPRPSRPARRRPARARRAGGPRSDPRADRGAPARASATRDRGGAPDVGRPRGPGRVGAGPEGRRAPRRRAPVGGGAVLRPAARGGRGYLRQHPRLPFYKGLGAMAGTALAGTPISSPRRASGSAGRAATS